MSKYYTRIRKVEEIRAGYAPIVMYYLEYRHKYWPFWIRYDYWFDEAVALGSYDRMLKMLANRSVPDVRTSTVIKSDKGI